MTRFVNKINDMPEKRAATVDNVTQKFQRASDRFKLTLLWRSFTGKRRNKSVEEIQLVI